MRRSDDFTTAVRGGSRAGRRTLVGHLAGPPQGAGQLDGSGESGSSRPTTIVGFVVSRAVGGAVVRNQVRRRLRHLTRARVERLPVGSRLVVRALPASAGATSAELAVDLDVVLARLSSRHASAAR